MTHKPEETAVRRGGVDDERVLTTPKAHPKEFRDGVVTVARRDEASISKVAAAFGISDSRLRNFSL